MYIDLYIIVITSIAIIAAILGLIKWLVDIKTKSQKVQIFFSVCLLVVIGVTIVYKNYGFEIFNPPIEPIKKEYVDISGSFTGYFVDEIGKQIPTLLIVAYNDELEKVIFTIKNSHTEVLEGSYNIDNLIVFIYSMGKGEVTEHNGIVRIKSIENNERKWSFSKDLLNL